MTTNRDMVAAFTNKEKAILFFVEIPYCNGCFTEEAYIAMAKNEKIPSTMKELNINRCLSCFSSWLQEEADINHPLWAYIKRVGDHPYYKKFDITHKPIAHALESINEMLSSTVPTGEEGNN